MNDALPNKPPILVPGIPKAAAPIRAALPKSDLAKLLTAPVTPLTAFLQNYLGHTFVLVVAYVILS
jgi:hypothetical protein